MSDEPPKRPRGERGSKKVVQQKILKERFERGEFVPKAFRGKTNFGFPSPSGSGSATSANPLPPPPLLGSCSATSPLPAPPPPPVGLDLLEVPSFAGPSVPIATTPSVVTPPTVEVPVPKQAEAKAFSDLSFSVAPAFPKNDSKGSSSSPSTSKGPQSKAKLSDPIPPGLNPPVAATGVAPPSTELRVSLDFHGVLDLEYPGAKTYNGIRTSCFEQICDFLRVSNHHRIGICSYIGFSGQDSLRRRDSLQKEVVRANRILFEKGVPSYQKIVLVITDDRKKVEICRESVSFHLDDKLSVVDAVSSRGVTGCLYSASSEGGRRYRSFSDLAAFLEFTQTESPRVYPRDFYQ